MSTDQNALAGATVQAIGPPGWQGSRYEVLVDVLRFAPALFGLTGAAVFQFHVERTLSWDKYRDQHSQRQAVEGCHSPKTEEWVRGPSGVCLSAFKLWTVRLVNLGVLKRERRYTKLGADAPTEYEVVWACFDHLVELWKTANAPPPRTPLFDGLDGPDPEAPDPPPDGGGEPVENGGGVATTWPPPGHQVATSEEKAKAKLSTVWGLMGGVATTWPLGVATTWPHKQSSASASYRASRLDQREGPAVEKGGFAAPENGGYAAPKPPLAMDASDPTNGSEKTSSSEAGKHAVYQNLARQIRTSAVRQAIEEAWAGAGNPPRRLNRGSNIPGVLIGIAEKLGIPDGALIKWMHEWADIKRERGYEIETPQLFVTAAQTNLLQWSQKTRGCLTIEFFLAEEARQAAARATPTEFPAPADATSSLGNPPEYRDDEGLFPDEPMRRAAGGGSSE